MKSTVSSIFFEKKPESIAGNHRAFFHLRNVAVVRADSEVSIRKGIIPRYYFFFFTLFISLFFSLNLYSQAIITPFSQRYQAQQRGGIVYVSNNILSCNGCTAVNQMPPGSSGNNNSYNSKYIDIDTDAATFSSSSADLDLPSCSEITFAGLYWGGAATSGNSRYTNRNTVKLKLPLTSNYVDLTADQYSGVYNNKHYQYYKDITSLVNANAVANGTYTLANVVANENTTDVEAGWTIVIVYKNDLKPYRNLTVFDGLAGIMNGDVNPLNIDISGFLTPPVGPVKFELGYVTYEGDRGRNGDYMLFNGQQISDVLHQPNNIFNSSITNNGSVVTSRNPAYNNTLGYDGSIIMPDNSSFNYISNSATSARLSLTTYDDTYIVGVLTTSIDVFNPYFKFTHTYTNQTNPLRVGVDPGDVLEIVYEATNIGNDGSIQSNIVNDLPQFLHYVPNSLEIQGVSKTDNSNDDEAEFLTDENRVVFRVGAGATSSTGGSIASGASVKVKFLVKVTDDCDELRCSGGSISNFGTINYYGNVNNTTPASKQSGPAPVSGECDSGPGAMVLTVNTPANCIALPTDISITLACETFVSNLGLPAGYSLFDENDVFFANPITAVSTGGTYVAHKKVNSACEYSFKVTVSFDPLAMSGTPGSVSCFGGTDGKLDVNITGGSAPYSYSWTGPAGFSSTSQNISALTAGTYQLIVKDLYGCIQTKSFDIIEPAALSVNAVTVNTKCSDSSDGSVMLTVTGGTAPYTFRWNTNTSWTTNQITNVAAGYYPVLITDANGCSVTLNPQVVAGTCPKVSFQIASSSVMETVGQTTIAVSLSNASPYPVTVPYTINSASTAKSPSDYSMVSGSSPIIFAPGETVKYITLNIVSDTNILFPEPDENVIFDLGTPVNASLGNIPKHTLTIYEQPPVVSFPEVTFDVEKSSFNENKGTVTVKVNLLRNYFGTFDVDFDIAGTAISGSSKDYTYSPTTTRIHFADGQSTAYITVNIIDDIIIEGDETIVFTLKNPSNGTIGNINVHTLTIVDNDFPPLVIINNQTKNVTCYGASDGSIDISVTGGASPYIYSWSNGAATEDISGLGPGSYTVYVTDKNGVVANKVISITQPTALSVSGTTSNVTCYGGNDGAINIAVTGGTSTYAYLWNDGSTSASRTNLIAGTYTVTIQDIQGCQIVKSFTITQPAALTVSPVITNASCYGVSNGKITLTVSGGTGPYTYSWNDGITTKNRTDLAAGTYTVTIKDAIGCAKNVPIIISQPNQLSLTESHTSILCKGSTSTVVLAASGGTGTYKFRNGTGASQTQNIFAVTAGNYTFYVTDANGCEKSVTITLTAPPAITAGAAVSSNYNGSQLSCNNTSDGEITITASGGTGSLSYSLDNGVYQSSNVFTGVGAGTHTISIKDANGCSTDVSITLTAPPAITAGAAVSSNYNGSQLSCNNTADGEITITASGGTGSLSYSLDGGTYQSSNVFTGVGAGTHTISIKDANGCSTDVSITLTAPPAITAGVAVSSNYNGSQLSCSASTDGEITITASGGTGSLSYSLDGGTYQSSNIFTNVGAGTHTISIKDANGCSTPLSITITAPPAITASAAVSSNYNGSQLSCSASTDGEITITASGGTGSLSYSLDGGTYQSSNIFTNVGAGSHTISIKDANGCSTDVSITLTAPSAITGSAAVSSNYNGSQLSCSVSTDGEITVTASGGTGSLSYSLDGGTYQSSNIFTGVGAGSHTISIKDANGCSTDVSITLTAPPAIMASAAVSSDYNGSQLSCNNTADGEITITASGGTGSLSYSLDGGTYQSSNIFTGVGAGSHTISIKDANGCSTDVSITLTAPSAITASATVSSNYNGSQLSCNTSTDGEITITASGGTGSLSYSLDGGTYQSSNVFTNVGAGTHTISIKDANGCSTPLSITITAPPVITASAAVSSNYNGSQLSCNNTADGEITITASGGTGSLSYSRDGGTYQSSNIFTNVGAGSHTISVKDANGCSTNVSITLTAPPAITASATVSSNYNGSQLSCNNTADGEITITASGGTGSLSYSLDGGTYQSSNIFTNVGAGSHTISVKDANGCSTPLSITITAPPVITASAAISSNYNGSQLSCNNTADGEITVTASGGTGSLSYSLDNGVYQSSNVFTGVGAGSHTISVKDANGCSTDVSITLTAPLAIMASAAVSSDYNGSQLSCNNTADGEITITASGGTGSLSYSLDGGTYQSSNIFAGVGAGTHTISIKDANGCSTDVSITLTAPSAITASAAVNSNYNGSQLSCNTSTDGEITITASGGTGSLSYSLD
uniref:beta strand repeat-containing protein n=1 Tax=Rubrolithibacter danxiaensis TaxID=3390805 RepID=UPI003BF82389